MIVLFAETQGSGGSRLPFLLLILLVVVLSTSC